MLYVSLSIHIYQDMGALELRNKLIEQFTLFLEDESKLETLDGIFDSLNTSSPSASKVPEEHYMIVEERRNSYHSQKNNSASWEEVKKKLQHKYGF